MTQEQMDFLRNLFQDIPIEGETPKERSDRKVKLFYQRLNFANGNLQNYLSEENKIKINKISVNFCRRTNGQLTFAYTVFKSESGHSYRLLFQNLSQVDLFEMVQFLDREISEILKIN